MSENSSILQIENICKSFGSAKALKGVSLDVREGEFIALVGPSGCGKTTLLNHIAGFLEQDEGHVRISGEDMDTVPAAKRPTSIVFQKLALFPHKTVSQNIGFPLKLRGEPKHDIDKRVLEMLNLMDLKESYLDRFPHQLSGGEQQRVALARSLISEPKLLLLDEPLSALDAKLKKVLQAELKRLHRQLGMTFVHVTHDLEEAMVLADRICVMRAGEILQLGTPKEIYYKPADSFVATFIGDTNIIPVSVDSAGGNQVAIASDVLSIKPESVDSTQLRGDLIQLRSDLTQQAVGLMIRPEQLYLVSDDTQYDCSVRACVSEVFHKGSITQIQAQADDGLLLTIEVQGSLETGYGVGKDIDLGFNLSDACFLRLEQSS